MRLLIWNIGGGAAGSGSGHTQGVIEVLRNWTADVHLLQEINEDQIGPIKTALGAHAFASLLPRPWWAQPRGDAIVSRWPFLGGQAYRVPMRKIRNPQKPGWLWHFVWGRVAHPDRPVHVFNVHYPLEGDIPGWEGSMVNVVSAAKSVRRAVVDRARRREAVILGGDFNQLSADIACGPDSPLHCENVAIRETARLQPETLQRIEGAHFSAPDPATGLPGFRIEAEHVDEPAAAIAEHPPVIFDVTGPAPPEPQGCAGARAAARGIPAEISRQRERMRGITPRNPDYWELRAEVEEAVAALRAELEEVKKRATALGCDAL